MNGATTESSTGKLPQDRLCGNTSISTTISLDTSSSSGDFSSPRSSYLCQNDRMIIPSMIPFSKSSNHVSMSHIFPSFRINPNKASVSAPGSSHTCRVCAKTFRASSLLDIHMRVHVGAKPFVCPICGHRATQKGNLKLHMKKHHGAELPPHIDLVPDSGIWGHPQENVLCASMPQHSEGVDNTIDASGRRKQVAQAVSSLLNEEVVELIKKYQNDVGQGTTGTITESLEDFIRIAKNKSGVGSKDATTVNGKPKKGKDDCRKKRLALSLRFRTNPELLTSKNAVSHSFSNLGNFCTSCSICGKSYRTLTHEKLPVCQECLVKGYPNSLGNSLDSQGTPNKHFSTPGTESIATINNVSSEELTKKTIPGQLSTYCDADGVMSTGMNMKIHKRSCNSRKHHVKPASQKEEFLGNLGLVSKSNLTVRREKSFDSIAYQKNLNPFIGRVMILDTKKRDAIEVAERPSEGCQSSQHVMKQAFVIEEKAASVTEREVGIPPSIRRRASPGVLNMLRQTLLNSADQKETNRQSFISRPEEEGGSTSSGDNAGVDGNSTQDTYHYRNPAMQSLAEIGKSVIFSDMSPESNERFQNCFGDQVKNQVIQSSLGHHEFENGYKCPYCPKWFKYRSVLEIHVRSHTGERPYKCPYCEYAGTQHNCLKLHIQRHHPSKNPYNLGNGGATSHHVGTVSRRNIPDTSAVKGSCFSPVNCPVCGRVSPSPGYLKIHMRSHKKSLDHVCHVCGRGFKEYWYLSTHLKTHERELNSIKFNLQHYHASSTQSKDLSNTSPFGSQSFLNKFATAFTNEGSLPLEPRIIKHEHTGTRRIYANVGDGQLGLRSESEQKTSTVVPNNDDGESNLRDHPTDKGVAGSRSRRRKASCPSRVVPAPCFGSKSPLRRSTQSPPNISETFSREPIHAGNEPDSLDELPLDLRCPAKKMKILQ